MQIAIPFVRRRQTEMSDKNKFMEAVLNLSKYHREHEKFYAQNPLEQAIKLHFTSRALSTLADRWINIKPINAENVNPYMGCDDLNDASAIAYTGVLFMEGEGEPREIAKIKTDVKAISEDYSDIGLWLSKAMETSWKVVEPLIQNPMLADVMGERHRIIINDWQSAFLNTLVSKLCARALDIINHVDFSPDAIRKDLGGMRSYPPYLYSAKELIDRAADLITETASLVHDNERRWRVFRQKVEQLVTTDSKDTDNNKKETIATRKS
jgi:hypothetical protein